MAGMAALRFSLAAIGRPELTDELARQILRRVKEVGQSGRTVDLRELQYIVLAVEEQERGLDQLQRAAS
jgi:hypothetical protein